MTEQEYLTQRVDHQVSWFSSKARQNKRLNNWTKSLTILLGASLPVLSQIDLDPQAKNLIIAIVGAVIAVMSGVAGIMKFQDKWGEYRFAAEAIKREGFLFKTRTGNYAKTENPFSDFVVRIENLSEQEASKWIDGIAKAS